MSLDYDHLFIFLTSLFLEPVYNLAGLVLGFLVVLVFGSKLYAAITKSDTERR